MARKKPAKKAKKKSAAQAAARKPAKKTDQEGRQEGREGRKKAAKPAKKRRARPPGRRLRRRRAETRAPGRCQEGCAGEAKAAADRRQEVPTAAVAAGVSAALAPKKKPNLDRPRKTVADMHGIPSSLDMNRSASSRQVGPRRNARTSCPRTTAAARRSPRATSMPTGSPPNRSATKRPAATTRRPIRTVVDDIGRALGVEYADDEELQGGAEIADRDLNRWELDPASKDDFDEDED